MMNRLKVECYHTGQDEQSTQLNVDGPLTHGFTPVTEERHDVQVRQPSTALRGAQAERTFDAWTYTKVLTKPILKDRNEELAVAARQALEKDKKFFMLGEELVHCAKCEACGALCLRLRVRSGKFSCSDCHRPL